MNKELLHILLSNPKLKNHFFTDVDGVLVFDKNKFTWTIENKEFLPDSYTRFKQKIGLIDSNERFISSNNDVVLSFPYKDCVLEGGQTKEDQKRSEIFFNETLAPEDVDCLLAPKVFTNIKKYTKDGEEKVSSISEKDNLLIKGNNLIVLSSLLKKYKNKVKLIYIDPPYNTGGDSFRYNDSFNHSSWLIFMKNRLELARNLLTTDGVIFVQCDDNEMPYLKVLMDELFEKNNFIQIVEIKANVGAANELVNPFMPKNCEYGLMYAKNYKERKYKPTWVEVDTPDSAYNKYIVNFGEESDFHKWKVVSLKSYFKEYVQKSDKYKDSKGYLNFVIDHADRIFQGISPKGPGKGLLEAMNKSKALDGWDCYEREDKENILCYKGRMVRFYSKNLRTATKGKKYIARELGSLWDDISWQGISKEGIVTLKKGKKPEKLLQRIIEQNTKEDDIVLDFFLGSGTTAAVALKMKRQFIGVEQMDYIEDLAVVRMNNVISGEMFGISKSLKWQGGGSFIYCELKDLNQKYIKQIQNAGSDPQLIELYNKISKSKFINSKVKPSDIESNVSDFESLSTESKRKLLIQLLDLNMLYVNYSDIDDEEYKVSDGDKSFNRSFYGD